MKDRLKAIRNYFGLTQKEFAERLGISRNNIASYETGKSNPGTSIIKLICREYGVNEGWFRTGEGVMFSQPNDVPNFLVKYNVDELEKEIILEYLRLPPEHRRTLINYVKGITEIMNKGAAASGTEPSVEDRTEKDER